MSGGRFDLAAFCARVGAAPKERSAIRQDLVRGLKDYSAEIYGYDRYGGATVLQLGERMGEPYVYGFAVLRLLHDRRLSLATKTEAAALALETIAYGEDGGVPFALPVALHFLLRHGSLSVEDLRYGLVATAGEYSPFRGVGKSDTLDFFGLLMRNAVMTSDERLFWGHSLVARHQDGPAVGELIDCLLGEESLPAEHRRELAWAWLRFRQPRLTVAIPGGAGARAAFIAEHMPFWVAHVQSWPGLTMVRRAPVWLARLGEDPLGLAQTFITYRETHADQVHAGVADLLGEHASEISAAELRAVIEQGLAISGSVATRRRFYRLGSRVFGAGYLERATGDTANSVRQWATRELAK